MSQRELVGVLQRFGEANANGRSYPEPQGFSPITLPLVKHMFDNDPRFIVAPPPRFTVAARGTLGPNGELNIESYDIVSTQGGAL